MSKRPERVWISWKRGQIEIEDAMIAVKNENGAVELKQLSNASSFWETRGAVSGYPAAPTVAGAFTDFGGNEKFVKELAEACLWAGGGICVAWKDAGTLCFRRLDRRRRDRFSNSFDKSAAGAVRAAFAKWKGNGRR
jgi:uncharacterized membrane protein